MTGHCDSLCVAKNQAFDNKLLNKMKEILYFLLIFPLVAVKCVEEKRFIIDSFFGGHASSAGHLGIVYISTSSVAQA